MAQPTYSELVELVAAEKDRRIAELEAQVARLESRLAGGWHGLTQSGRGFLRP
jgi:hypothetical protein